MMRLATLSLAAALAACSAEKPAEQEPQPRPKPTRAAPRTLVAADLDLAALGARVEGMDVTDAAIGGKRAPLARVSAFVACPKDIAACDPAVLPAGTAYTYVLTITPTAPPTPTPTPSETAADPAEVVVEAPVELVRMTQPVSGFEGAVGFVRAEAIAALGADTALTLTLDQNRLIWRVTGGDGWQGGKPITLWWQSTTAPAKPSAAYRLEFGGHQAVVTAPFPAADKPVDPKPAR